MHIALGMSGGVDSSLCAHLLQEQGHQVTGVFLECWRSPGCRADEDRADALKVALSLNLPFQVLDFKKEYKEKVVEYFFAEYQAGRTPNPDVMCNKEIKFGMFYDWAMASGFDAVATGHYAKSNPEGELIIPADLHKDQTYFLYLLNKSQLQHTIFPLANLQKSQVRIEAEKRNIHVSSKPDSTGICFIGEINVHTFLKERLGENPGEVVDTKGRVIGSHQGLWFYTIGQRHGFEINKKDAVKSGFIQSSSKENFPILYVVGKNPEQNQLIVGRGAETLQSSFQLSNLHWINNQEPDYSKQYLIRIRHTGQLLPCQLIKNNPTSLQVNLIQPSTGIAEGQAGVIYWQDPSQTLCLGGGVITS